MIKKILPKVLKDNIKLKIMKSLQLVPSRNLDIANNVISKGIFNFFTFSFEQSKTSTLNYISTLEVAPYTYKYSISNTTPTLYGSIYVCMLKGMYGELDNLSIDEKRKWADYFDSFQSREDGYFRDPVLSGEEFEGDCAWGDGWGIRHLAGHIIIAYARLGFSPKYKFKFLEEYYNTDFLLNWLNKLFEEKEMWGASNYIMNICTLLQYSRDYMGDKFANFSIEFILNWLDERQNANTGMWHDDELDTYKKLADAIRGAYHYYPLYIYEFKKIRFKKKVIDYILKSQNSWGGFEDEGCPSGACEDIDAIDPLIRFSLNSNYRKEEIILAVKKAFIWVLSNKNEDGGFVFMPKTPHEYGSHPVTSSLINESNLFATWFRTLTIAYITQYLDIDNEFQLERFPGYEQRIRDGK